MSVKKIVVVEDEPDILELLSYNLRREGFEVLVALDGAKGMSLIQKIRPDLVLLDLMLPGIGGLDICRQLKADSATQQIPIIMVTAYANLDAVSGARDTGVNEIMAKPLSVAALEKRIRHVLEDLRAFVESETFSGPDRRRSKKASLGGPERREKEPMFLTPPGLPPAVR